MTKRSERLRQMAEARALHKRDGAAFLVLSSALISGAAAEASRLRCTAVPAMRVALSLMRATRPALASSRACEFAASTSNASSSCSQYFCCSAVRLRVARSRAMCPSLMTGPP